jgi:hypothetical protein
LAGKDNMFSRGSLGRSSIEGMGQGGRSDI